MIEDPEYPYISRWGQRMGLTPVMVAATLAMAIRERAPATAVFKSMRSGAWKTVHDITSPETRAYFIALGWMTSDWTVPGQKEPAQ